MAPELNMSKEMFVSITPHESRVAVNEDDQLAEIYYERENEYTLAGSIYKGRVTRVLPGMQSAFVDIGLERDAFLYVTDFFELEDEDDEIEPVPIQHVQPEHRQPELQRAEPAQAESHVEDEGAEEVENDADEPATAEAGAPGGTESGDEQEDDRGGRSWRGGRNRRRRGRRGRGFPETKYARTQSDSEPPAEKETPQSGPPAGYQPIILPGESIAKFNRQPDTPGESQPAAETQERAIEYRQREERPRRESRYGRDRERESREREPQFVPPPGYQPIVLPGESISKYRRQEHSVAAPADSQQASTEAAPYAGPSHAEPEGAAGVAEETEIHVAPRAVETEEQVEETHYPPAHTRPEEHSSQTAAPENEQESSAPRDTVYQRWDAPRHTDEPHGGVLGAEDRVESRSEVAENQRSEDTEETVEHEQDAHHESGFQLPAEPVRHSFEAARGTSALEEEEIEEEEADLSHPLESVDDEEFDELEEETLDAQPFQQRAAAPSAAEQLIAEGAEAAELSESEEEGEEEEHENGKEAEAEMLAADEEPEENGEGNGRAELRALSGTAGYQQRAPNRQGFDRRGDRGRGRRGGRRFRQGGRPSVQRQHVAISEILKEGQEVLVQIAKEPIGKKGARITSHIALPGRFMVYMPTVNHIGVSRKIASDEERLRLKRIVAAEREAGHGGFIVRTAAEGISEEELRNDIRFLKHLWSEIKTRAENSKPPALIYHDLNLVERTLRDQLSDDFTAIWVDNDQEYERIVRFMHRFQPGLVRRVKLYTKETPLFEQFNIQEEINKALKSKVWLKSGGYIVINQTEALVAIDVNTGKYVGKTARLEDTIVKTNIDAIKEIVRQIRLRDLGGIIVIDFIDMDERRNRQKVMQALEEALRADRAPSKVLQFNDFGLVAITRKRVKHSLERVLGTPCPYCTGTGLVKSVSTVCNEIFVEMRKMKKHLEGHEILLRVNPEVAKALKANNARYVNEMEELTGKTVIVKSDPTLHQEQFDM